MIFERLASLNYIKLYITAGVSLVATYDIYVGPQVKVSCMFYLFVV